MTEFCRNNEKESVEMDSCALYAQTRYRLFGSDNAKLETTETLHHFDDEMANDSHSDSPSAPGWAHACKLLSW